MAKLTLVPLAAKKGSRFRFAGPNKGEECVGCPYQKLCFGLEPHHAYEVVALRDLTHPCNLHDGGRVRVAQVEEVPFRSSIETRHLRGTAAPWEAIPCGMPECPTYALCHPVGTAPGRHQIVKAGAALPCPAGFELTRVELKPMAG